MYGVIMVISELALGFLTNLLSDSFKKIPKELSDAYSEVYNKTINQLSNNYNLDKKQIDVFLDQGRVERAIRKYLKNPNKFDCSNTLTNEFFELFGEDNFSHEDVNSILNSFFEILDAKIEESPELREYLKLYLAKDTNLRVEMIYNELYGRNKEIIEVKTDRDEKESNTDKYNRLLQECEENLRNFRYEEAEKSSLLAWKCNKNDNRVIKFYARAILSKICNKFKDKTKNILVIGDLMLDHTMIGHKATYPEVASHHKIENVYMLQGKDFESYTLGGVGYLGRAFSVLVGNVIIVGVIGEDYEGKIIEEICTGKRNSKGKIIEENENKFKEIKFLATKNKDLITTTKIYFYEMPTRVYEAGEGVRFDREDKIAMSKECSKLKDEIIQKLKPFIRESLVDCVVIDDYEKGLISDDLMKEISQISNENNNKIFVDPKNDWLKYKNFEIEAIIANNSSYRSALSSTPPGIELLEEYCSIKNIVIKECKIKENKNGEPQNGAYILNKDKKNDFVKKLSIEKSDYISDVGCGLVFDAFLITSMLYGYSLKESVFLANYAACLKTKKQIGDIVTPKEILENVVNEEQYFKDNKFFIKDLMINYMTNYSS